ncbi:MAG: Na(+)/H(+) antiporter subunit D [Opitutales bacterium]|nr:Na(+)/H(+) antiporter subunit D [Opitutales bacterium]
MIELWIHPSVLLFVGALVLPLLPVSVRRVALLGVPALVLALVLLQPVGNFGQIQFLDWGLEFGRVDALSRVFAIIMALMCLLGSLYALKVNDVGQHIAAWVYVGGSLGVIFAGDLLVLFLFWELMALSSVFLIWARRSPESLAAGFRYLLVHTAGGLALLAGIVAHGMSQNGDFSFNAFAAAEANWAVWLILIGILLNAAVPPLHAWLPDAYPAATFSGSVFLSAFTTKTAVYALCRGFAGFEILLVLGVVMALYGVIYAFLANDPRRLLSYHIVSQVGFMVAGVGIGTAMAVNGAIAHAFAHILYKGLLFMGTGAVLYQTGRSKFTELGGLYQKMPWTMLMTLIGALSISAVPLFSGFVSKSMTIAAGYEAHHYWAAYLLMLASIGTFVSIGLKLIYQIWFGERRADASTWEKAKDPGWNMMAAMGITAFLCFLIGVYPHLLYQLLPHAVDYQPFTSYHLSETILLLSFAALGFYLLRRQMAPKASNCLDLDWPYRKGGGLVSWMVQKPLQSLDQRYSRLHESAGIRPLMESAGASARFDNRRIDGAVDGLARLIRNLGTGMRVLQRGSLQQNLTLAFASLAVLLFLFYLFT